MVILTAGIIYMLSAWDWQPAVQVPFRSIWPPEKKWKRCIGSFGNKRVLKRFGISEKGEEYENSIPHGRGDAVRTPGLAAMVIPGGVEFEALDGEPVTLMFLIAAPNTKDNVHLDVLSKLSVLLMDEEFRRYSLTRKWYWPLSQFTVP